MSPRTFTQLQDHQRAGVRWLIGAVGRGGGILGDDPGLGKTLQVLAAVDALIATRKTQRVLIVAPASLLGNWEAELGRWRKAGVVDFRATVVRAGDAGLTPEDHLRQLADTKRCARLPLAGSRTCRVVGLRGDRTKQGTGKPSRDAFRKIACGE